MDSYQLTAFAAAAACLAALLSLLLLLRRNPATQLHHLRILAEQSLAASRGEAESTRRVLADMERALTSALAESRTAQQRGFAEAALLMEAKLREMAENNAARLAQIQHSVNEQLHEAVEKQMTNSFARVIEQFAEVQKAMGDVQAVTAQIGDLKRVFANVKTRGGWGETQLRALLDDVLPEGAYRCNVKLRQDSDDMVEFAIIMPMRGADKPLMAIDAKFPMEDYERLLNAAEAGDAEAERAARRGLETRLRAEAKKIAEKYICPPETVEFAVLYLPTDGLYAEAARIPGLLDDLGSRLHVMVLGPALAPALLRTVHLGFVTLQLEQKAEDVRRLLGATRGEMLKMDEVLDRLGKQAGTMSTTIERARTRTRAVDRKLRTVAILDGVEADALLELDQEPSSE